MPFRMIARILDVLLLQGNVAARTEPPSPVQKSKSQQARRKIVMLRICLPFLLAAFAAPGYAQEAVPPEKAVLTLEEAVTLAQAHNRSVKNAQLLSAIDDDHIAEARTYRFPSLHLYALGSQLLSPVDFTFSKGAFGSFSGIGPVPAQDTNIRTPLRLTFYGLVQFLQPISQQYKIGLNIRQARLSKLVDEQGVHLEKQQITNQVKQAYYAILQTQSALASSDENLRFDRELDRTTAQYVAEKTALKSDSMEIKARIAQEEYANLTLHDALASQKEQLNDLLGRDIRIEFTVEEMPEATAAETSMQTAENQALSARPELRQTRLTLQEAELNRRVTKAQYLPDVSFALTNLSLANVSLLPSNVASAGVLVTWDPIDWGRRKHELAAADQIIEQSKNNVDETEARILLEVRAKFRKLSETRALWEAAQLNLDAEREKQRVVMNQYAQKAALLKDVLQQRASVESANEQFNRALLSFWTAKADFEKSLGEE
jgi:outer membrane protein